MKKETTDQAIALLEKYADKLGTKAEHLWEVLIKQAPIDSWCHVIIIPVVIILMFISIRFFKKTVEIYDAVEGLPFFLIGMVCLILNLILSIYFSVMLPTIISGFFNPEYWALQKILSL